jgi:hypothetical protein
MDRHLAYELVQSYVEGWKNNDLERITGVLALGCIVIESHGPTYRGADVIKKWIEGWIEDGSTVDRWDITSFYFVNGAATFEWDFACTVSGKHYSLSGASIVKFDSRKITAIHEYRMTAVPFDWTG